MFPPSRHRAACCPSLHIQGRQGGKPPIWGTSTERFKLASVRSLQAWENFLHCCTHPVPSRHLHRQPAIKPVVAALCGPKAMLVTTEPTAVGIWRQRGLLSAEHRSLIWKRGVWCSGVGGGTALRKAGVRRQGERWEKLWKVNKILVAAGWLGSQKTGYLPSRLCLESQNNLS